MTESEALSQAKLFNDLCSKRPWLDIDVVHCSPESLILHCGIDLSAGPEIELRFDAIFFASLLMTWKTDTARPVLRVLIGKEATLINRRYQVEHGYHLFAFHPEGIADDVHCTIAAKAFSWRTMPAQ